MRVLGLDIGGTSSRIALIEVKNKPVIIKKKTVMTKEVNNISKLINDFNKEHKVKSVCVGFAGPVIGNKAKLTNAHLKIDLNKVKKETKIQKIVLKNDFHVAGYGIPFLNKKELVSLNKGKNTKKKVEMVVGPGTGLGKVHIIEKKVFPCEAGWTSLGVDDIDDYALLDYLRGKYGRSVYYEDVLSGKGLIDIYDHLEIKSNLDTNMKIRRLIKEEPVHKAKVLIQHSKTDKLCDMTLNIFTKFYARFIRDSCLNLLTSNVYLIGGISGAIEPYLKKGFIKEFLKHDVYSRMLKKVSINIVLNEDVGLIGAGAIASNIVSVREVE